jgi:hypothetical protein
MTTAYSKDMTLTKDDLQAIREIAVDTIGGRLQAIGAGVKEFNIALPL